MYGRVDSGFVRSRVSRQSGSSPSVWSAARSRGRSVWRHSSTISRSLSHRLEQRRVDAFRHDPVVAREAQGRRVGHLPGRRQQHVDSPEQLLALRAPGRIGEALGGQERRDGQALGLAQREVREARQRGLEAVDDVEAAGAERAREVRPHAERHAHAAAPRDRHGRAEHHELALLERAVDEREPARRQICRAVRRRDDRHRVSQHAQLLRDPGYVLVHLVRPRPRERRDETDPKAPFAAESSPLQPADRAISRCRTVSVRAEVPQRSHRGIVGREVERDDGPERRAPCGAARRVRAGDLHELDSRATLTRRRPRRLEPARVLVVRKRGVRALPRLAGRAQLADARVRLGRGNLAGRAGRGSSASVQTSTSRTTS